MASFEGHPMPTARKASVELNLTPMIDVVFQLLIYFLLGTSFVMGEQSYRMDLPERLGRADVNPFELDEDPLRIEVRSRTSGLPAVHVPGPWKSPNTIDELRRFLAAKRIDQGGLYALDHPIHIQPDSGTTWGDAVEVFNAAFATGYEKIGFNREIEP